MISNTNNIGLGENFFLHFTVEENKMKNTKGKKSKISKFFSSLVKRISSKDRKTFSEGNFSYLLDAC